MSKIKIYICNAFAENTYLVYDESNECIIIDPGCSNAEEFSKIRNFIKDNNLRPQFVINTHGHIDHILGVKFFTDTWNIPFYIHSSDVELVNQAPLQASAFGMGSVSLPSQIHELTNTSSLQFGQTELKILCTPGHSKGGICLYSEKDKIVFTGDTLFAGSIGRTDLPGGDYDQLMDSIYSKLLVLPHETKIYPGHGPYSNIEDELAQNPFLLRLGNNNIEL